MDEIIEMMAYARLEPFGGYAEDYRAGIIAATLANVNRDSEAQPGPFYPRDFMPAMREPEKLLGEGMTAEQLSDLIDAKILRKPPTVH